WLPLDPIVVAIYLNSLTFLVSGLVIGRLDIPPSPARAHIRESSVVTTILDGWRFIGRTPLVRGLVLGMLGAFAAAGFVIGLAPAFVSALGAGAPGYGALFAAVFLGMALGMWIAPRLLSEF